MCPLVRGIDQVTGASVKSNTGDFGSLWEVVCVERRKKGVLEKHCQKVEVKKKKKPPQWEGSWQPLWSGKAPKESR